MGEPGAYAPARDGRAQSHVAVAPANAAGSCGLTARLEPPRGPAPRHSRGESSGYLPSDTHLTWTPSSLTGRVAGVVVDSRLVARSQRPRARFLATPRVGSASTLVLVGDAFHPDATGASRLDLAGVVEFSWPQAVHLVYPTSTWRPGRMSRLVEFPLRAGASVLVPGRPCSTRRATHRRRGGRTIIEQAGHTFEAAITQVQPAAQAMTSWLRALVEAPGEVGAGVGGEAQCRGGSIHHHGECQRQLQAHACLAAPPPWLSVQTRRRWWRAS